ncbi:hypothetical protein [Vibrio coralliilyticus]|uniref:Uncharacterized protein n=1 Tax=Vibrio coralliilyticus TaxID=190893 RepID=A0AAP6ZV20_9VIBR|nr:hypothetical protein [Vibrio coralliilyticus]NOJ25727.1 hypothetical protein [Vibrio coralliilyticus]
MSVQHDSWCKRIDLHFRAKYPNINTRIFKVDTYRYSIVLIEEVDNFDELSKEFDESIRYITAPVFLEQSVPAQFEYELEQISDSKIPSNFEGFPLTRFDIFNHISCLSKSYVVTGIDTDHSEQTTTITLKGHMSSETKNELEAHLAKLGFPFKFLVVGGGSHPLEITPENEVFSITSSRAQAHLNCDFLERDENLWFKNVEAFYDGSFKKDDLYFYDSNKTSCLVNFSLFQNANLRNHLLLYDTVYCELPLQERMSDFLNEQMISRDELLHLVQRGRLKIVNTQPESRLDYGFLNEVYQTCPNSVVSRRALAALNAIDLVSINQSYIMNHASSELNLNRFIKEISALTRIDQALLSKLMLWPKFALRHSFSSLHQAGPKGIASYGVNNPISAIFKQMGSDKIGFEFTVSSDQIHLAHALDSTYFPFFTKDSKYTDHPFVATMGSMLNFYKSATIDSLPDLISSADTQPWKSNNRTIDLISTFDINSYIPVTEFEREISSSIIRSGMNSLFAELYDLNREERSERILHYNSEVSRALSSKDVSRHALDLGEDAMGLMVPFFATGSKLIKAGTQKAIDKFPAVKEFSEFIEDKTQKNNQSERNVSILSKINRVARLKQEYC